MPVVAAAPEKITPLIKRLRVSFEFTDIAPFSVFGMHTKSTAIACVFIAYIATLDVSAFYPGMQ